MFSFQNLINLLFTAEISLKSLTWIVEFKFLYQKLKTNQTSLQYALCTNNLGPKIRQFLILKAFLSE